MLISFHQAVNITPAQKSTILELIKDAVIVPSKVLLEADEYRPPGPIIVIWSDDGVHFEGAHVDVRGTIVSQVSSSDIS